MSASFVAFGTEIALPLRPASELGGYRSPDLLTLQDLVNRLRDDPTSGMLRSAANKFAEYKGKPCDEVRIETLDSERADFREFLRERGYSKNSVRSYSNYVNMLVGSASRLGWGPTIAQIPPSWDPIVRETHRTTKQLIRHLAKTHHEPSTVQERDLSEWTNMRVKKGLSFASARKMTSELRRVMIESGLNTCLSAKKVARPRYGISLEDIPDQMRCQVQDILRWKQDAFVPGRPAKAHVRGVTAKNLEHALCRLIGFTINVLGKNDVVSLSDVVTEGIVTAYVNWALNTRKLKNGTVRVDLARIIGGLGRHPKYSGLSSSWLPALLECIQEDSEHEVRRRKEEKYLPYEVLQRIPVTIRTERPAETKRDPKALALSFRDELLLEWMLALPWRQRNHRECRIGGENPNLFKARVPALAGLSKPEWLQELEKTNPEAEVWQIHFSKDETKTHHEVDCVLPRRLAGLVEEYVSIHRKYLVAGIDPGTLFLNDIGNPFITETFNSLVGSLTLRHAGRRVTPHLFRDIFAFMWLKKMPEDYLTLSKLLWHRNIQTTIRKYGWMCNESSALCRMERVLDL